MGALQLKIAVPIMEAIKSSREWHVPLLPTPQNGLSKKCVADCFQVKSVSTERCKKKLGVLQQKDVDEVKLCLIKVLDLF
jgi:mRNA interferase MazF